MSDRPGCALAGAGDRDLGLVQVGGCRVGHSVADAERLRAVLAAYGLPEAAGRDQILAHLLELNPSRAGAGSAPNGRFRVRGRSAGERQGLVRRVGPDAARLVNAASDSFAMLSLEGTTFSVGEHPDPGLTDRLRSHVYAGRLRFKCRSELRVVPGLRSHVPEIHQA